MAALLSVSPKTSAARLAGINVWRTRYVTYALSGLIALLCGVRLSRVSGGRANLIGIWGQPSFFICLSRW